MTLPTAAPALPPPPTPLINDRSLPNDIPSTYILFSARKSCEEQENPRNVQLFSDLFIRDWGCAPTEALREPNLEFRQLLWLVQSKLSRACSARKNPAFPQRKQMVHWAAHGLPFDIACDSHCLYEHKEAFPETIFTSPKMKLLRVGNADSEKKVCFSPAYSSRLYEKFVFRQMVSCCLHSRPGCDAMNPQVLKFLSWTCWLHSISWILPFKFSLPGFQ